MLLVRLTQMALQLYSPSGTENTGGLYFSLIGGNMYQFPCPTDGQCRKQLYERYGWDIRIYSLWGYKRLFGVRYRCCTGCHLPLNKKVADWLNQELGYTSNDIQIDKDFMELLNGIE